jgi:stearoyl-CoA desaturase (delta-9 desaturase)
MASRATTFTLPAYATWSRFNAPECLLFVVIHLMALSAPLVFSWTGAAACLVMTMALGQVGVIMGYHRMLAHGSFAAKAALRYALVVLGVLSLQEGPISWAAIHRYHHLVSDRQADPHSPQISLIWAHWLWPFFRHPAFETYRAAHRLTPDLERDAGLQWLERRRRLIVVVFIAVVAAAGFASGGPSCAASLLVWGYAIPVVYAWQMMLLGASVNHTWGYRNYTTADNSRNTWWIALLSFGDGWHNNHHAYPRSAAHGHRWFEYDLTYRMILCLNSFRLTFNVARPPVRPGRHTGARS